MEEHRKRGRPRKNSIQQKVIIKEEIKQNQIILHLPITLKDIDKIPKIKKEIKKKDNFNLHVIQLKVPIIKIKNNEIIVDNPTNIVCWWCTHKFDTIPCFLPEDFTDGKFYVLGCFCSFNCAVAYNFSLNDYKVWDRYSLLNKMYYIINGKHEHITMSPPREILEKFGGTISIEEFRKSLVSCTKEYRLVLPPMIPIIPFIEERMFYVKNK
jgi:hypothetical protein